MTILKNIRIITKTEENRHLQFQLWNFFFLNASVTSAEWCSAKAIFLCYSRLMRHAVSFFSPQNLKVQKIEIMSVKKVTI